MERLERAKRTELEHVRDGTAQDDPKGCRSDKTAPATPRRSRGRSCCRAIKTHATKRSIVFLCAKARAFDRVYFIAGGRALDRGQRMLELWNSWYDTLASAEALATVIVIVLVAASAIVLAESRWR
jgi:hypothetical protein